MFINKPGIVSFTVAGGAVFPFEFKWFNETDIIVYHLPQGAEPDDVAYKLSTSEYTITANPSNVGGSVTITKSMADGDTVTIQRSLPFNREVSFAKRGSFTAENVNKDNDYQTYLLLDLYHSSVFYLKKPYSSGGTQEGADVAFPAPYPSGYIRWDETGTFLENDLTVPEAVGLAAAEADRATAQADFATIEADRSTTEADRAAVEAGAINVPAGTILMWHSDVKPLGYLWADGSTYSVFSADPALAYDELYQVLVDPTYVMTTKPVDWDTNYPNNPNDWYNPAFPGSVVTQAELDLVVTTPDLRGIFPRGKDQMGTAVPARGLDSWGVVPFGEIKYSQNKEHTHDTSVAVGIRTGNGPTDDNTSAGPDNMSVVTTTSDGGTEAHPTYNSINYIIRSKGKYYGDGSGSGGTTLIPVAKDIAYDDTITQEGVYDMQAVAENIFAKRSIEARVKASPDDAAVGNAFIGPTYSIYNCPVQDSYDGVTYAYVSTNSIYKYTPIGATALPLITQQGTGTLAYSNTIGVAPFFKETVPGTVYYLHGEYQDPILRLMKSVDGGAWQQVSTVDATGWANNIDFVYNDFDTNKPVVIGDMVYIPSKTISGGVANITTVNLATGEIVLAAFTITCYTGSNTSIPFSMSNIGNKLYLQTFGTIAQLFINTYDLDTLAQAQFSVADTLGLNTGHVYGFSYYAPLNSFLFLSDLSADSSAIGLYALDKDTLVITQLKDLTGILLGGRDDGLAVLMSDSYFFQGQTETQVREFPLTLTYSTFSTNKTMTLTVDDNGKNSFAHGEDLVIPRANAGAFGEYNTGDADSLFEVGMGTSDIARANAIKVTEGGDVQAPNAPVPVADSLLTKTNADTLYPAKGVTQSYVVAVGDTLTIVDGVITSITPV